MQRLATVLTALLFALSLSACDSTEFDDDDNDVRQPGIQVIELAYDLFDAEVAEVGRYNTGEANVGYELSEITPSVVRDGAVLVYIEDVVGTWRALPFTQGVAFENSPEIEFTYSMNYAYDVGVLDVFVTSQTADPATWDLIRDTDLFFEERTLKAVIFSEFATARAHSAGVDLRSYSEVKEHFGLEE